MCSEGTPHRKDRGRGPRHGGYAAFLQNAELFCRVGSQGWHPGLVCDAHSGHGVRNRVRAWDWERIDVEGERYRTRQKTLGEAFGAATGFSDPRLQKIAATKDPNTKRLRREVNFPTRACHCFTAQTHGDALGFSHGAPLGLGRRGSFYGVSPLGLGRLGSSHGLSSLASRPATPLVPFPSSPAG